MTESCTAPPSEREGGNVSFQLGTRILRNVLLIRHSVFAHSISFPLPPSRSLSEGFDSPFSPISLSRSPPIFCAVGIRYFTSMGEEKGSGGGGGGGDSSSSSRVTSSFEKFGDRIRFTVELRPGETTIVSWKKLMKDASKADKPPPSAPEPPPNSNQALASAPPAPGKPADDDLKDAAAPHRFSAVIEKIERLYMVSNYLPCWCCFALPLLLPMRNMLIDLDEMELFFFQLPFRTCNGIILYRTCLSQGKDSSDEEDLDGIPDDDQYDTEDSFIDDAELDEYFEVDKSKTKHDGFFVNRGKLESIEPSQSSVQQPKKRRRKEIGKDPVNGDDRQALNKQMNVGKKTALKIAPSVDKSAADGTLTVDTFPSRASNDSSHSKHHDRGVYGQIKVHAGKLNNVEGLDIPSQQKERNGNREQIDLNIAVGQHSVQTVKSSLLHKKDGSVVRPKGNSLEKAIRELEKMVADSRPPTSDIQDADASSQAVKRRLPREMKQKLAKVARLATSHGKVSKELLSRLMSILGHLMQLRTLKRHLKILANTSLSANQEKEDKFQRIKKEVVEMIKMRAPSLMSKAVEQQVGGSDDFQESGPEGKGSLKGYYSLDAALEDHICDLYDIFIDGLDDVGAPQVRKLYAELAELWPKGVMDNHGIKRAICRAKERRKTQDMSKVLEKIRKKKVMAAKIEQNVRVESSSGAQPSYVQDMLPTDSSAHAATSHRFSSSIATAAATAAMTTSVATIALGAPNLSHSATNFDRPKQEKAKGIPSTSKPLVRGADGSPLVRGADGAPVRKKVKRKAESEVPGAANLHKQKLPAQQINDKKKSNKQSTIPVSTTQKPNLQLQSQGSSG
ncbi:hypothetical protein Dimus_005296 [Dionaea muscipula]